MEHESDRNTNSSLGIRYCFQKIDKGFGELEIRERVKTVQSTAL